MVMGDYNMSRGVQETREYPGAHQPFRVAQKLISEHFLDEDGYPILKFYRGEWWRYQGTHWAVQEEMDLKTELYEILESAVVHNQSKDSWSPWNPDKAKIAKVLEPLRGLCNRHVSDDRDMPYFVHDGYGRRAQDYAPVANGLVYLPTGELYEHTPRFFAPYVLPYEYSVGAQCPTWDRFLADVFEHDPAAINLLQEWAGYLISGRTDLHKALLLIGPPRGGKGTISRTIKALIGMENTASPGLRDFASDFGLEQLVGKPLAVVEDARGDDKPAPREVERILNITGEDQVSLNRKNRSYWIGTLNTRLMFVSNETPKLIDASGAIVTRFMSVNLVKSFADKPDATLGSRIMEELPGVFNWALEGAKRLERQGAFTVPATMEDVANEMRDLAAPVQAFIRDQYEITSNEDDRRLLREVYQDYKQWCRDEGRAPVSQSELGRRINALAPRVRMALREVKESEMNAGGWSVEAHKRGKRKRDRFVLGII